MRRALWLVGGILVVTLALRLLWGTQGGGGFAPSVELPTDWGITKLAGNPIIDVDDNPAETTEQYVPAPVQLPNGDVWAYVKGFNEIYAWRSTDGGETFTLMNGGAPAIGPGSGWEATATVEPAAVYDPTTDTIHLYYKGYAGGNTWAWGHATADGSDPTTFARDPANPILTSAAVSAALGGGTVGDLAISDVVKIDDVYHFFGYAQHSGRYQIIHASGADWDAPSGVESLLLAATDSHVVQCPSVFKVPGGRYAMFYSEGTISRTPAPSRSIKVASSDDAESWTFDGTVVMTAGSGWEAQRVYAASLLKDGVGPTPLFDESGRWRLFYSGSSSGSIDNSGLAYMAPS